MADNNDAEDEFSYHAQATHHPAAEVTGEVVDIVSSANIDSSVEQTGHGIGVVLENPELTSDSGSVWTARNDVPEELTNSEYNDLLELANAEPEEGEYAGRKETTEANINGAREELKAYGVDYEDADPVKGTDYKIADGSHDDHSVQEYDGNIISVDVGGGAFDADKEDDFDSDTIMVWYGGLVGQFVTRGLDFNGLFFANHDNDSFTKGVLQVPRGWRNGDTAPPEVNGEAGSGRARGHLAAAEDRGGLGRAPRVARVPILRPDVAGERISIELDDDRRVTITDAEGDDIGLRNAYDEDEDVDAFIEDALDVDDAASVYEMYYGDGWEDEPENTEPVDNSGGSFDVDTSDDSDEADDAESSMTDKEREFAEEIVAALTGSSGVDPTDAAFDGMTMRELGDAQIENFDTDDPNYDAIEAFVRDNTPHLDAEDAPVAA